MTYKLPLATTLFLFSLSVIGALVVGLNAGFV